MTFATYDSDAGYHAGEGQQLLMPAGWVRGQSKGVIYAHSLGGTALQGCQSANPGFYRLVHGVAACLPVLVTDMSGPAHWGDDVAAYGRIPEAKTYLEDVVGCIAGDAWILSLSMGNFAALRYFADNPWGALVSVIGGEDLDDVRNFNRPTGWTGTTPNAPQNTNSINLHYSLALNSTGDYPTHGQSLVALPAGLNPALRTAELVGLPRLAFYATDDTTVPQATTLTAIAAIGAPAEARSLGALGHTDAAAGAVPTPAVVDWFLSHST